jgi:ribose transport system permease protein
VFAAQRRIAHACSQTPGALDARSEPDGASVSDDVAVKRPGEGSPEEVEHVPTAEESTAVVEEIVEQAARPGWRTRIVEQPTLVLVGVFAVLYAVTVWQDDSLLETGGIRSILLLACPLAIFAASQTLCMLTGGIDLSIAMTANLAAYVAAVESGQGTARALLLALTVGLIVGFVNGLAIGVFRVNPLIMTLGMASVLLGIITVGLRGWLSGSTNVLDFVRDIGSGTLAGPLPKNLIVWVIIAAILVLGLRSSGLGRMIYAVGDNPIACRLAGVRVWQVLLAVYVLSGLLAAIGGLLFSGTTGSVGVDQTNNYLLPSVAATVIGGTSILGGTGGYAGTILGALILTVLNRLLLRIDVSEAVKQMLYGAIVLVLAWLYVRLTGQKAGEGEG